MGSGYCYEIFTSRLRAGPLSDASTKMTVPEVVNLMEDEIEIVVTELTGISKFEVTIFCKVDDHILATDQILQSFIICLC